MAADRATAADRAMVVARATVVAQVLMVLGRAMGPTGPATAVAAQMPWRARSRLAGAQLSPMRRRLPAPRGAENREACAAGRIVTLLTWLDVRNRLLLTFSCSTTGPPFRRIAVTGTQLAQKGNVVHLKLSVINQYHHHYHPTSSHRKNSLSQNHSSHFLEPT